jgi:hypothetical protein
LSTQNITLDEIATDPAKAVDLPAPVRAKLIGKAPASVKAWLSVGAVKGGQRNK